MKRAAKWSMNAPTHRRLQPTLVTYLARHLARSEGRLRSDIFATAPNFARCGKVRKVRKKRVSGNKTHAQFFPHPSNPPLGGEGAVKGAVMLTREICERSEVRKWCGNQEGNGDCFGCEIDEG